MKVVLCTGDSHTQGQGQDTFSDPLNGEWPVKSYNLMSGSGLGFKRLLDTNSYVNLVRKYIEEKTGSKEEQVKVDFLKETKEITFDCRNYDMFLFTMAENIKETFVNIYTDGEFYRRICLYTDSPRWDDWSARDIRIDCSGKDEIKFICENETIRFVDARRFKGSYAVVNCGIGSCDCKTFADLTLNKLIDDTTPYMFIAEAHTINDWLRGKNVEEYKKQLTDMLSTMIKNSEHTILLTVSPILGEKMRTGYDIYNTVDYYDNFITGSIEVGKYLKLPVADAYTEFLEMFSGLNEEQIKDFMYCDVWHVNSKGHRVYADKIIEQISDLIQ